jgi:lipid-binding SYLF domain-containing protein
MYFRKSLLALVAITLLAFSPAPAVTADKDDDQAERALKAAEVLNEIMATPDKGVPDYLLERAKAIAVIPHVVKGALGVGGRFGKGLIISRKGKGWGTPSYMDLSGGSFGLQIGVSASDVILIFTDEAGVKSLLEGKLKLGADAAVVAGPVGRSAEAGTDIQLKSGIYSYSRSKGLFAGIALDGAVLTINDSANHKVYGKNVSGHDILLAGTVAPNATVMPFVRAVQKNVTRAKTS